MKKVMVFSQTGSLMPAFARMVAELCGKQVVVGEKPDEYFPTLGRLLDSHPADMWLVGYPHTDHADMFALEKAGSVKLTGGANVLHVREGRRYAEDTRPLGLHYALQEWHVVAGRTLIVGKQSPAFAAALACERNGASSIEILNRCGVADPGHDWKGVNTYRGRYDLVINTMRDTGFSPEELAGLFGPSTLVVDLVYTPRDTALLRLARGCGSPVQNGILPAAMRTSIAMNILLGQAERFPREMCHDIAERASRLAA